MSSPEPASAQAPRPLRRDRWPWLAALLGLGLLALALRLYRLDTGTCLEVEEYTTAILSQWRPLKILTQGEEYLVPFSYLVMHLSTLASYNTFTMRLPAAILGAGGVVAMALLGRAVFDRRVGLVAALLVCFNPLHVYYSQNAKFYAAFFLLSALSLLLAWRAMEDGRRHWWLLLGLCSFLNIFNHLFALLLVATLGLFCLIRLVPGLRRRAPEAQRRGLRMLQAALLTLALYLPWIPPLVTSLLHTGRQHGGGATEPAHALLGFIGEALWSFMGGPGIGPLVPGALLLVGLAVCLRRKRALALLTLLVLGLPVAVLLAFRPEKFLRHGYLIFAMPLVVLVVAAGIHEVAALLGRLGAGLRLRAVLSWSALVLVLGALIHPQLGQIYRDFDRGSWTASALRARVELAELSLAQGQPEVGWDNLMAAKGMSFLVIPEPAWCQRNLGSRALQELGELREARARVRAAWPRVPAHYGSRRERRGFENTEFEIPWIEGRHEDPGWLRSVTTCEESPMSRGLAALERVLFPARVQARDAVQSGMVALERGDPRVARRELERALDLEPQHPGAWLGLGLMARDEGDLETARALLQRATEVRRP